jgi:RsiW-degrading membrane proteinase PrsW (M82 family)
MNVPLSVLGLAATIPALLYIWMLTAFERQSGPPKAIIRTFVLGAIGAFLSAGIVPHSDLLDLGPGDSVFDALLMATRQIAIPEETVKLFVLLMYARRHITSRHPLLGATLGAAVGLGFAAAENFAYLVHHPDRWQEVALVRAVITMPLHGSLGVIMGIYFVRAHFAEPGENGRSEGPGRLSYLVAWLAPVVLHALFDLPFILIQTVADLTSFQRTTFEVLGFLGGALVISMGAVMIYRVAEAQAEAHGSVPHPALFSLPSWRKYLLGGVVGLAGIAILVVEGIHVLAEGQPDSASVGMLCGGLLLVAAALIHRRRLERRSAAYPTAAPPAV